MKVRPMLLDTEMVKAIIAGRKTAIRRPMNPQPQDSREGYHWWPSKKLGTMIRVDKLDDIDCDYIYATIQGLIRGACPIANVGDLIYVRETFCCAPCGDELGAVIYKADHCMVELLRSVMEKCKVKWFPSVHMPREYSRITLKVTDVRIEEGDKYDWVIEFDVIMMNVDKYINTQSQL